LAIDTGLQIITEILHNNDELNEMIQNKNFKKLSSIIPGIDLILSSIVDMPLDNSLLEALSKSLKDQLDKENEKIKNKGLSDLSNGTASDSDKGIIGSGSSISGINGSGSSISGINGSGSSISGINGSGSSISGINGIGGLSSNSKNQAEIQNALNNLLSDPTNLVNSLNKLPKEEILNSISKVLVNLDTNKIWINSVNNISG